MDEPTIENKKFRHMNDSAEFNKNNNNLHSSNDGPYDGSEHQLHQNI